MKSGLTGAIWQFAYQQMNNPNASVNACPCGNCHDDKQRTEITDFGKEGMIFIRMKLIVPMKRRAPVVQLTRPRGL